MNNDIKTKEMDGKEEIKSYKCQICNKEAKDPIEAMTHYLHHGSTALAAVTAMIEDQRTGNIMTEESKATTQKAKVVTATQEA